MIEIKVKKAKNLKEKIIGLLGKKTPEPLLIKTRFGIHTFGLKFPIDVVVLDKENKVVKLKENLKPFRIFLWNPNYNVVLELPKGSIKEKEITKNSQIQLNK